ncbi:hypothetical protein CLAVI_000620 [Candidatus Clavichlamydia salmonicola]|uniref:hypothetical protein n=1 Tax=Candidatus Clavichlamydia salmonicola TaxID=469812 RepID=UPI001890D1EA|nr:hypothetical protein [Candidatus Clavichlamydia salmonicola]MBF5050996.1 hypothetical protein [Candidatus Clavichlamydia salmonicola]
MKILLKIVVWATYIFFYKSFAVEHEFCNTMMRSACQKDIHCYWFEKNLTKTNQNHSRKRVSSEPWNFLQEEENFSSVDQDNDHRDVRVLFSGSKCTFVVTNPGIEEVLWFIEDFPDICQTFSLSTMSSVEEIIFSLEQLINHQFKKPVFQDGAKSFTIDKDEKGKASKSRPLRLKKAFFDIEGQLNNSSIDERWLSHLLERSKKQKSTKNIEAKKKENFSLIDSKEQFFVIVQAGL